MDFREKVFGSPSYSPTLDPTNPHFRFVKLQNIYRLRDVTKQRMLFQHTIAALPANIASLVFVIITKELEDNCYDPLKRAVISRLTTSQEKRRNQLFSQVELGIASLLNFYVACVS
nr:gag pol polyprotein [Hymenolepis microstoma]